MKEVITQPSPPIAERRVVMSDFHLVFHRENACSCTTLYPNKILWKVIFILPVEWRDIRFAVLRGFWMNRCFRFFGNLPRFYRVMW
jgi:hypothetical protein